jgi:hypothetical protein
MKGALPLACAARAARLSSAAPRRSYAAGWYASQKATLEEVSFLPIMQIMKDVPMWHSISPSCSAFRAVHNCMRAQHAAAHGVQVEPNSLICMPVLRARRW